MSILEMKVDALMRLCAAEKESERKVLRRELLNLMDAGNPSIPDHLLGHPYVVQGVLLCLEDRMYIDSITFGLYPQLAARFDTTAARVERAIRNLVEVTWSRGNMEILNHYFGNTVSPEKGKPTNGEFIARLTNIVRLRLREAA